MTDNLKCPVCGAGLQGGASKILSCPNVGACIWAGIPMYDFVWRTIIDGKAAQDALKDAIDEIDRALYVNYYNDKSGVRKILKDLRESITKQENE